MARIDDFTIYADGHKVLIIRYDKEYLVGRITDWTIMEAILYYKVNIFNPFTFRNVTGLILPEKIIRVQNIEEKEKQYMAKLTGYKQVAVIKQGYGTYHFAIYEDGYEYKVGDSVIVSGNNQIQTIDEIISPEEAAERYGKAITAEIICPIDLSAYHTRVEKRKAADALKKKMDKVIKEMDENSKYDMYAERNPELKDMLEQYKSLIG